MQASRCPSLDQWPLARALSHRSQSASGSALVLCSLNWLNGACDVLTALALRAGMGGHRSRLRSGLGQGRFRTLISSSFAARKLAEFRGLENEPASCEQGKTWIVQHLVLRAHGMGKPNRRSPVKETSI